MHFLELPKLLDDAATVKVEGCVTDHLDFSIRLFGKEWIVQGFQDWNDKDERNFYLKVYGCYTYVELDIEDYLREKLKNHYPIC